MISLFHTPPLLWHRMLFCYVQSRVEKYSNPGQRSILVALLRIFFSAHQKFSSQENKKRQRSALREQFRSEAHFGELTTGTVWGECDQSQFCMHLQGTAPDSYQYTDNGREGGGGFHTNTQITGQGWVGESIGLMQIVCVLVYVCVSLQNCRLPHNQPFMQQIVYNNNNNYNEINAVQDKK